MAVLTVLLCLLGLALEPLPAQTPATTRAAMEAELAGPDDAATAEVRKLFAGLADHNAEVREAALTGLLNRPAGDLPRLRKVVATSRPLQPNQSAHLRSIVTHLFLKGQDYLSAGQSGFMGVTLADAVVIPASEPGEGEQTGIVIINRLPGFAGYGALRDGDVIVRVLNFPHQPLRNRETLQQLVLNIPPGEEVRLKILRQGQVMDVAFQLSKRPNIPNDAASNMFLRDREEAADVYWRQKFSPLLAEQIS
jgi:hypothetical protein